MNLGLEGKIAVVTASSEGLGKATALALAEEGARLVLCARRQKELNDTAEEIRSLTGAEVTVFPADVSKADDITQFSSFVLSHYNTIHVLVNNAGGPPAGNILTLTDEDWQRAHQLTLMSVVRLVRAFLPSMVQQRWGRIITITSIAAKQPINELLLSVALRPGIHGLTKVLANEYGKYNITVNTVCPGNVLTKRQKEIAAVRAREQNISYEDYLRQVAASIPAGRLGKPEEIGTVIAFLASEQASYINGVNLLVDGGAAKGIF